MREGRGEEGKGRERGGKREKHRRHGHMIFYLLVSHMDPEKPFKHSHVNESVSRTTGLHSPPFLQRLLPT